MRTLFNHSNDWKGLLQILQDHFSILHAYQVDFEMFSELIQTKI